MKKVLAALLVLTLAVCFAACGKTGTDNPTTENTLTANIPQASDSTDDVSNSVEDVSNQDENSTMLLTTQAGETMPTVQTTAFVPDPAAVSTATQTPGGVLTVPTMSAPTVVTSAQPYSYYTVPGGTAPPYVPSTRVTPTFSTTQPTSSLIPTVNPSLTVTTTTRAPATTTTTSGQRSSKTVTINDCATTADKQLVVTIDPAGWDGKFQNNSQNVTVKVDGVTKSAPATVKSSAKNADGYQYITIDLSELSVPEGAYVQFTIPSAFLQTASGAQYNSAFSGAYTMM